VKAIDFKPGDKVILCGHVVCTSPESAHIKQMVRVRILVGNSGNDLHFKDLDIEPERIHAKELDPRGYLFGYHPAW
jgi:hypothetical protein